MVVLTIVMLTYSCRGSKKSKMLQLNLLNDNATEAKKDIFYKNSYQGMFSYRSLMLLKEVLTEMMFHVGARGDATYAYEDSSMELTVSGSPMQYTSYHRDGNRSRDIDDFTHDTGAPKPPLKIFSKNISRQFEEERLPVPPPKTLKSSSQLNILSGSKNWQKKETFSPSGASRHHKSSFQESPLMDSHRPSEQNAFDDDSLKEFFQADCIQPPSSSHYSRTIPSSQEEPFPGRLKRSFINDSVPSL